MTGAIGAGLSVTPGTRGNYSTAGQPANWQRGSYGRVDFDAIGSARRHLTSGYRSRQCRRCHRAGQFVGGVFQPQGPSEAGFSVGLESANRSGTAQSSAESVGFATAGSVPPADRRGRRCLVLAHGNIALAMSTPAAGLPRRFLEYLAGAAAAMKPNSTGSGLRHGSGRTGDRSPSGTSTPAASRQRREPADDRR